MEFRCSPCYSLLLLGVLGIFIFCGPSASAQCKGDFTYQSVSSEKGSSGTIQIAVSNADSRVYTFNVYKMEGKIILVETREVSSPDKVVFEGLKPSSYYVKIEWGNSCRKILGGLEGIKITGKDQGR